MKTWETVSPVERPISPSRPQRAQRDVTQPGGSGLTTVPLQGHGSLLPGALTLTGWGNGTVIPLQVGGGDGVEGVEGQAV